MPESNKKGHKVSVALYETKRIDGASRIEESAWLSLSQARSVPDDKVVDEFNRVEEMASIEKNLHLLNQREMFVLRERARGLELKEIGGQLRLGKERVRQIESEALSKIRRALHK